MLSKTSDFSNASFRALLSSANGISPLPSAGLDGPSSSNLVAFMKGVGAIGIGQNIPDHDPPAPGPEKLGYFFQRLIFVQPVKGGGAGPRSSWRPATPHLQRIRGLPLTPHPAQSHKKICQTNIGARWLPAGLHHMQGVDRVAVPVPAPISKVAVFCRRPQRAQRSSNTQFG